MTAFKKGLPIFLISVFLITLLDSIGAIASRELNFRYSYLSPISFLSFILVSFFITKKTNKKTGIIFAGLLGLFDATIGWKISMVFKANIGHLKSDVSTVLWIVVAVIMIIFASILGLLGAWVATMIYKIKSTNR